MGVTRFSGGSWAAVFIRPGKKRCCPPRPPENLVTPSKIQPSRSPRTRLHGEIVGVAIGVAIESVASRDDGVRRLACVVSLFEPRWLCWQLVHVRCLPAGNRLIGAGSPPRKVRSAGSAKDETRLRAAPGDFKTQAIPDTPSRPCDLPLGPAKHRGGDPDGTAMGSFCDWVRQAGITRHVREAR
jgi:hypothetical protein